MSVPKNMQSEARKSHMMSFLWSIPVDVGASCAAAVSDMEVRIYI
jgi:hypothetical protein